MQKHFVVMGLLSGLGISIFLTQNLDLVRPAAIATRNHPASTLAVSPGRAQPGPEGSARFGYGARQIANVSTQDDTGPIAANESIDLFQKLLGDCKTGDGDACRQFDLQMHARYKNRFNELSEKNSPMVDDVRDALITSCTTGQFGACTKLFRLHYQKTNDAVGNDIYALMESRCYGSTIEDDNSEYCSFLSIVRLGEGDFEDARALADRGCAKQSSESCLISSATIIAGDGDDASLKSSVLDFCRLSLQKNSLHPENEKICAEVAASASITQAVASDISHLRYKFPLGPDSTLSNIVALAPL